MSGPIVNLLRQGATKSYNVGITELQHALKSAYVAEHYFRLPEPLIVGSLLHDIGHLISPVESSTGNKNHAEIGATWLQNYGFPPLVCQAVKNHVIAKRYLKTVNPEYELGSASLTSFYEQGGPLNSVEMKQWLMDPNWRLWLTIREIDDAAKTPDFPSDYTLESLSPMIDRVLKIGR